MACICQYCEREIPQERVERALRRKMTARFCSDRCQKGWSHHRVTEAAFLASLGLRKAGDGLYERECGYCGRTFTTRNTQQRHCSAACNKLMDKHGCTKAEWDARHAESGVRKAPPPSPVAAPVQECPPVSADVRPCPPMSADVRRTEADIIPCDGGRADVPVFFCSWCGERVPDERALNTFGRIGNRHYCSDACRYAYKHFRCTKAEHEASLRRVCKFCGSEFVAKTSGANFCCRKCGDTYARNGGLTKSEWEAERAGRSAGRKAERGERKRPGRPRKDKGRKALLPAEVIVERLRSRRSQDYFAAVFRLPEDRQLAEIGTWTEEDHEKALALLGVRAEEEAEERPEIDTTTHEDLLPYDEENPGA